MTTTMTGGRRRVRGLGVGLGVLAALAGGGAGPARAAACLQPAEQAAFGVHSLQSLLMVAALTCRQEDSYNAFVTRYRRELGGAYRSVAAHFRRAGGGTRGLDAHITNLANAHSQDGIRQGAAFCGNTAPVWGQVMALPQAGTALAGFAAERNVTQVYEAGQCPARSGAGDAVRPAVLRSAAAAPAGAARVVQVSARTGPGAAPAQARPAMASR